MRYNTEGALADITSTPYTSANRHLYTVGGEVATDKQKNCPERSSQFNARFVKLRGCRRDRDGVDGGK